MGSSIRRFVCALAAAGVTAGAASTAPAQGLSPVAPGTRLQIVLADTVRQAPLFPARQVIVGTLVRATADSVWLQPPGASAFGVAHGAIRGIRVSRGVSRPRSAATFGVGLGLVAAAIQLMQPHESGDVIAVGGIGLGVGALVGAVSPFEHWRRLPR